MKKIEYYILYKYVSNIALKSIQKNFNYTYCTINNNDFFFTIEYIFIIGIHIQFNFNNYVKWIILHYWVLIVHNTT